MKGLCIRCAEKWSRDHRCADNIQLHALQEFWDICHADDCLDQSPIYSDDPEPQLMLALSVSALKGTSPVNAIHFQGSVQGVPARILIDLGSSHTFVSRTFAAALQGQSELPSPLQVKIADGQFMTCTSEFSQLQWAVQNCTFQSVAKVISLGQYDLIVDMDWLSQFNPMQVDWQQQHISVAARRSAFTTTWFSCSGSVSVTDTHY